MGLFRDFIAQTRKPEGFLGKMMVSGMNGGHAKLADWGMSHLEGIAASNIAELGADGQVLSGTILVGDNSTLTLTLQNGSAFEGCISGEIVNAKGEQVSAETGTVNVSLDESSTWTLTADTYITSFSGSADSIVSNGYTLFVNGTALAGTK